MDRSAFPFFSCHVSIILSFLESEDHATYLLSMSHEFAGDEKRRERPIRELLLDFTCISSSENELLKNSAPIFNKCNWLTEYVKFNGDSPKRSCPSNNLVLK
nr:hypothetical protein Iba_chr02dCG16270 [Ipomoea batatas]